MDLATKFSLVDSYILHFTTDAAYDSALKQFGLTHRQYRRHNSSRGLTPGLISELIEAKDFDNLTLTQIINAWKISRSQAINAIYNDTKATRASHNRDNAIDISPEDAAQYTRKELAEIYGVSRATIAKILGAKPNLTKEQRQSILVDKRPVTVIAAAYNVKRDTIYKIRQRGC